MSDDKIAKLLPCPFCGGEPYIWQKWRVICGSCDAEGPDDGDENALLSDRIAAWNKRVTPND